jgi:hypothetical protein
MRISVKRMCFYLWLYIAAALCWVGARFLRAVVAHRPLHSSERKAAKAVFGCALNLNEVRIADIAPYTDYLKRIPFLGSGYFAAMDLVIAPYPFTMPVLIHELTHVWQSREGPLYMPVCLLEHAKQGENVYDVDDEQLTPCADFRSFGYEQQAAIVERYFELRYFERRPRAQWRLLEPWAKQVHEECQSEQEGRQRKEGCRNCRISP